MDLEFPTRLLEESEGPCENLKKNKKKFALHELVWPCVAGILLGWCRTNGEQDSAEMTLHRCSCFYCSSFRLFYRQKEKIQAPLGRIKMEDNYLMIFNFFNHCWMAASSQQRKSGEKTRKKHRKLLPGSMTLNSLCIWLPCCDSTWSRWTKITCFLHRFFTNISKHFTEETVRK